MDHSDIVRKMLDRIWEGKTTDPELDRWISEKPSHQKLWKEVSDPEQQTRAINQLHRYDSKSAWNNIQQRVAHRARWRMGVRYGSAAAALLLIASSLYFLSRPAQIIEPGHPQATVLFDQGKAVHLDSKTQATSKLQGAQLTNNGTTIVFSNIDPRETGKQPFDPLRHITVSVPIGGEYQVVLADGTTVTLNSGTTLRFARNYAQHQERIVALEGEAFFDVTPNPSRAFIVECGSYTVTVKGTSFNISNYPDDGYAHVTVASGEVAVTSDTEQHLLHPGEQAKIFANHSMAVASVTINNYTSWMDANFRFEGMEIDAILRKIARWYNLTFVYENPEVKQYHFTGYLPRYSDISEIFRLLSLTTDVAFKIEGRTVTVSHR